MDSDTMGSEILKRLSTKLTAIICLSVAILFLCVHIVVFLITEYERTIMGKSFAMLCLTMLLGYVSYIGNIVLQNSLQSCIATVIACHFLSTAQSAWLLTTSIETWKSIKTTKTQQEYELKNSWRFFYYSLYSWIIPAFITATTLYLEFGDSAWSETLKPNFSDSSCGFGQANAFFLLHILPVNVNLAINFLFIAATVIKLQKMKTETLYYHRDMIKEFKYYLRLNGLIGITWLIGLLSEYTRSEIITVVYVLLNAIQGFYIFLIMTFHDKISTFIYYVDTEYDLKMLTENEEDDISQSERLTGMSESTRI